MLDNQDPIAQIADDEIEQAVYSYDPDDENTEIQTETLQFQIVYQESWQMMEL